MGTPGTNADTHGQLQNPDTAHELSDINVRAIIGFVIVLAVTALVVQLTIWGMMVLFDGIEVRNEPAVSPMATPAGTLPPEPRLQTTPWRDLEQFRAGEVQYLNSFGWVDKQTGVAHLPIDRAKDLLLERGIPTRPGASDPTEGTHVFALGESNSAEAIPAGRADMSSGGATAATPGAGATGAQPAAGAAKPGTAPKKPGGGTEH
jgi:hypothetical protein